MSPNHGIWLKHEINLLPDTPPSWTGQQLGQGLQGTKSSRVWGAGQVPGRTIDQATMPCQQEAKFSATVLIFTDIFQSRLEQ